MFDTLKYSKILEAAGVPREQSEAHVGIIAEIVEANLATKQDIDRLRLDLIQLEYRLTIKLGTIVTLTIGTAVAILKLT